jgi:hypothetical protein
VIEFDRSALTDKEFFVEASHALQTDRKSLSRLAETVLKYCDDQQPTLVGDAVSATPVSHFVELVVERAGLEVSNNGTHNIANGKDVALNGAHRTVVNKYFMGLEPAQGPVVILTDFVYGGLAARRLIEGALLIPNVDEHTVVLATLGSELSKDFLMRHVLPQPPDEFRAFSIDSPELYDLRLGRELGYQNYLGRPLAGLDPTRSASPRARMIREALSDMANHFLGIY